TALLPRRLPFHGNGLTAINIHRPIRGSINPQRDLLNLRKLPHHTPTDIHAKHFVKIILVRIFRDVVRDRLARRLKVRIRRGRPLLPLSINLSSLQYSRVLIFHMKAVPLPPRIGGWSPHSKYRTGPQSLPPRGSSRRRQHHGSLSLPLHPWLFS